MALVISMISRRRPGNSFHILTRSSPPQLPEYVVLFLLQSMPTLETEQAFVAAPIEPQAWRVIPRHGVESLVVYPTCERLSIPTRHRRMRPCCLPSQMGASAYAKWAFFPMFSVFTSLIFTMIPLHRAERTPDSRRVSSTPMCGSENEVQTQPCLGASDARAIVQCSTPLITRR